MIILSSVGTLKVHELKYRRYKSNKNSDKINNNIVMPYSSKSISTHASLNQIVCTEGLVIVLKSSNNLPACIKPSSVEKLIQRGWATEILSQPSIDIADLVFENGLIYTVDKNNLFVKVD